jgi:hypothetical protein
MGMAWVEAHNEVRYKFDEDWGGWVLCFQRCTFHLDNKDELGYRFIWRRPDGSLQAARGQARIPDAKVLCDLTDAAKAEGWFK